MLQGETEHRLRVPDEDHAEDASAAAATSARRPEDAGATSAAPRRVRWPWLLGGLVVAGSLGVIGYGMFAPSADVTTEDAYVRAHYATIAPRISGQVATVQVDNTQWVKAGQQLATLDARDFEVAVSAASAQLDRDRAQISTSQASIDQQKLMISQAEADVRSTAAQLSFATVDARRYDDLAATGAGTVKSKQQADTALSTGTANAQSAKARLGAAHQQLSMAEASLKAAVATSKLDQSRLDQANLNLSYTRIRAPVDGMVAARSVQVGDYVSAGTTLMTVVPLESTYVDANFREVQLAHVATGQAVDIHVDAYNVDIEGVVVGVPAASGTTFAPIQPDNATGNFTKIVQRLPVRIAIRPNQSKTALLRVGMSVETTIHTGLADVTARPQKPSDETGAPAVRDQNR